MPRYLPITQRGEPSTTVVHVVLAIISHPSWPEPIRISSDPTERLSDEPYKLGTRHDGAAYEFVWMGARLPDDIEGEPLASEMTFWSLTSDAVKALRALRRPVTVELRELLSSDTETVLARFSALRGVEASGSGDEVTLQISREYTGAYAWPYPRMTYRRFPGLRR